MPRFFVPPGTLAGEVVTLQGENARHVAYSLRMAAGDEIILADGTGEVCRCVLERFDAETVLARVLERQTGQTELPVPVWLYPALPKGDKLEWIVQKAVELGACGVRPFVSRHCVARPQPERVARQTARLCRIAEEAAGQCGRAVLPPVLPPLSLEAALEEAVARGDRILLCYEGEDALTLRQALERGKAEPVSSYALFVGAEGGFAPEEVEMARGRGALSVSLGPRILRCETAPLYALSAVSYAYEL